MNASGGERGMGIRSGPAKQGWEQTDFPMLCETCLGENPYLRMTKSQFGAECKVCSRPFTVFRWKPGTNARYKKTEICQTCAKVKNVCQTCIFDLDFGLPVELRDKFIDQKEVVQMPLDVVNRDFWAQSMAQNIDKVDLPYKKPEVLEKLQILQERHIGQKLLLNDQTQGTHKRNLAHVCSFYVQGKCNRGKACPYRHDNITEEDLQSMQKGHGKLEDRIKDRFNGSNDQLAKKIINKIQDFKIPQPPEDDSISTLFIGDIDEETSKEKIHDKFLPFGKITGIRLIPSKKCGFICFQQRKDAETAFETLYERLYLQKEDQVQDVTQSSNSHPFQRLKKLKLLWAKSQLDVQNIKQQPIIEKSTKEEKKL